MRAFRKFRSIKIIRPEFFSFSFDRFCSVKANPNFVNSVIINTGSDNIQVARNTHIFNRVCYTRNRIIRIRINKNIIRSADNFVTAFILYGNHGIVLAFFFAANIKFFLPAVHLGNVALINIALATCKNR